MVGNFTKEVNTKRAHSRGWLGCKKLRQGRRALGRPTPAAENDQVVLGRITAGAFNLPLRKSRWICAK